MKYETKHADPFPELIARFPHDMTAQKELYRRLRVCMKKQCRRYLDDLPGETLDDLTHDAAVKIILRMDRFSGDSRFTTWAIRVGRNEILDRIKVAKRRRQLAEMVPLDVLGRKL